MVPFLGIPGKLNTLLSRLTSGRATAIGSSQRGYFLASGSIDVELYAGVEDQHKSRCCGVDSCPDSVCSNRLG